MPYNLNMENIIIHTKTCDMLPSISSTILHVRCSEHVNSKSVQSSPIWRYFFSLKSGFQRVQYCINPSNTKLFKNINMHLHIESFINIKMTNVAQIHPKEPLEYTKVT